MVQTLAQLLGTPVHASEWDLNDALEQGTKASGGSSAIAPGRVAVEVHATGVWAIATAGSTGRMGIIPNLYPVNADGDTKLKIATRPGAEYFVEGNSAAKPGAQLTSDTGGKVKATTGGAGSFIYLGHDGEGTIGNPMTDGAAGEAWRVRITGVVQ
jgi:hypothetical protein